jgi:hypothetical protein
LFATDLFRAVRRTVHTLLILDGVMGQVLTLPVGFHEIIIPVLKANPYTIFYDGFYFSSIFV